MISSQTYYSNAKLLLSGEYLVLHGAWAFAVPVKYGQSLEVYSKSEEKGLEWIAHERGEEWLRIQLTLEDIDQQQTNGETVKGRLCYLLKAARLLNPDFLSQTACRVVTDMDFDRNWGLGSSSTLIANVAQWAQVDPFDLHYKVSKGSGYDIACATASGPILFRTLNQQVEVVPVVFDPPFKNELWFVYLGQKQNSEQEVKTFLQRAIVEERQVERITAISTGMIHTKRKEAFDILLREHEHLIGTLLGQQRIRSSRFPQLKGEIKSLGAWGGDFAMVRSEWNRDELQIFFNQHGLKDIFSWEEMVLNA